MRTALRWLPADGSGRRCTDPGLVLALRQLRSHGLCGYEAGPAQGKALWRLTGMARALRAEMERSEGLDAGPEG